MWLAPEPFRGFVHRGAGLQTSFGKWLELAEQSLAAQLAGAEDTAFGALAEQLDVAVVEEVNLSAFAALAAQADPLLGQYVQRVVRRVASEEDVPAAGETWRVILAGAPVLLPAGLSPLSREWREAALALQSGLAAVWAEDVHSVTVMRHPVPLAQLEALSPSGVRCSMLQAFAQKYADEFALPEGSENPVRQRSAWVLPVVIAAHTQRAREFVSTSLSPAPLTRALSMLKHRFETYFESPGEPSLTPSLFPPLDWANVLPTLRAVYLRKVLQETVTAHGSDWRLTFNAPNLVLASESLAERREFFFPEETEADIVRLAGPLAQQLGIGFQSNLH